MDIASILCTQRKKGIDLRLFMRKLGCVTCEHVRMLSQRTYGTTKFSHDAAKSVVN